MITRLENDDDDDDDDIVPVFITLTLDLIRFGFCVVVNIENDLDDDDDIIAVVNTDWFKKKMMSSNKGIN